MAATLSAQQERFAMQEAAAVQRYWEGEVRCGVLQERLRGLEERRVEEVGGEGGVPWEVPCGACGGGIGVREEERQRACREGLLNAVTEQLEHVALGLAEECVGRLQGEGGVVAIQHPPQGRESREMERGQQQKQQQQQRPLEFHGAPPKRQMDTISLFSVNSSAPSV